MSAVKLLQAVKDIESILINIRAKKYCFITRMLTLNAIINNASVTLRN
jgi:hypothetical protein